MRASELKEKIEELFKEARNMYPHITDDMLDSKGAIHYMNGKNSTRFDWEVNNHLSAFVVFHKDEMGFIRAFVSKDGTVEVYIYECGELAPTHSYVTKYSGDVSLLYKVLCQIADGNCIWDRPIDILDWNLDV